MYVLSVQKQRFVSPKLVQIHIQNFTISTLTQWIFLLNPIHSNVATFSSKRKNQDLSQKPYRSCGWCDVGIISAPNEVVIHIISAKEFSIRKLFLMRVTVSVWAMAFSYFSIENDCCLKSAGIVLKKSAAISVFMQYNVITETFHRHTANITFCRKLLHKIVPPNGTRKQMLQ